MDELQKVENYSTNYEFKKINPFVDEWIRDRILKVIVPELICKLKQNSIFKLGYEVKSLIDNFLDVEKSESYLDFSPLKMEISEYKGLFIDITEFESLTETELKNRFSEILKLDGNEIKFPIGTTVETFQAKNI